MGMLSTTAAGISAAPPTTAQPQLRGTHPICIAEKCAEHVRETG